MVGREGLVSGASTRVETISCREGTGQVWEWDLVPNVMWVGTW